MRVTSPAAKFRTPPLAKKISSPAYISPATPNPPSVWIDPVVVLVDSVVVSTDRTPPSTVRAFEECVRVTSPLLKFSTPPSLIKISSPA